ncbi:MAG: thiamine phosphate synthase [Myxococcota bacterium]
MTALDVRVYLVTDPDMVPADRLVGTVLRAVQGGTTLVQLRDKRADGRALAESSRALLDVLRPRGVPLIVNDRADVARAVGADGVHVGQSDLSVEDVRRVVGPSAIVGLSIETVAQVDAAPEAASYLAVSPVYGTATKANISEPLGLAGVAAIRKRTSRPLVGIGGIDAARSASVVTAGADGVAVVSAILASPDAERASRQLRAAVDAALEERKQ